MRPVSFALRRARRRMALSALTVPRDVEEEFVRGLVEVFRDEHRALLEWLKPLHVDAVEGKGPRVRMLFGRMARGLAEKNRKAALRALDLIGEPVTVRTAVFVAREASLSLIDKALREYAEDVRKVLSEPKNFGKTREELRELILERGTVSEKRAELIARDQTCKLNGAINKARQEAAGVEEYEWSTVGDDRVRPHHRSKEGRRFRWDEPPSDTGHPGEDYQCRCVGVPVIP